MLKETFLVSADQTSKDIIHYTIGFARLSSTDNIEDAVSAGSGTLVTIGSLHGILTAAHVLDALPKTGEVGLILNAETPGQFRKQVIYMDHAEKPVIIRGDKFGPNGPDLGFLKITDETLGWLKATNSFYSLTRRREDVLSNKHPSPSHSDSIVGVIHELTHPLPDDKPGVRRIQFVTLFSGVHMSALKYLQNHRLSYFQLQTEHEPGFPIPKSFKGTSGGAVWRFYVTKKDGRIEVVDHRLIAVPFYEGISTDGKQEIVCHEAKDIYGRLVDEISSRWPKETNN